MKGRSGNDWRNHDTVALLAQLQSQLPLQMPGTPGFQGNRLHTTPKRLWKNSLPVGLEAKLRCNALAIDLGAKRQPVTPSQDVMGQLVIKVSAKCRTCFYSPVQTMDLSLKPDLQALNAAYISGSQRAKVGQPEHHIVGTLHQLNPTGKLIAGLSPGI